MPAPHTGPRYRCSPLRSLVELLSCIAVSVMLTRGFLVEGFLISTGSMAPQLLGHHKQVVCPDCRFPFARVADVDSEHPEDPGPPMATCPNCGHIDIDIHDVPRNDGDQLLVHKLPWLFRSVRRWEPVVFHRPGRATLMFVKRVVGLPGETIQIVDGDIHANGRLCRKTLTEQRANRVGVYNDRFRPTGSRDPWTRGPGWTDRDDRFLYEPPAPGKEMSWLIYRHRDVDRPGPIRDRYAYNPRAPRSRTRVVRDLLVSLDVESPEPSSSRLRIELDTGEHRVAWVRDSQLQEQWLLVDDRQVASSRLSRAPGPLSLEFSTFDRTLRAAVATRPVFDPVPLPTADLSRSATTPLQIGASGAGLVVSHVRLDRDIFYRDGPGRTGTQTAWQLGADEYFVLGDNSPVSLDSRSWPSPSVPHRLLVGRPLLVHLPSRPWLLRLGDSTVQIRIPDLGRIRYIR